MTMRYTDILTAYTVRLTNKASGETIQLLGKTNNFQPPGLIEQFEELPSGTGFRERVFREAIELMVCTYDLRSFQPNVEKLYRTRVNDGSDLVWPTVTFQGKTTSSDLGGHRQTIDVTGRIFGLEPGPADPETPQTYTIQQDVRAYTKRSQELNAAGELVGTEETLIDIDMDASKFIVDGVDTLAGVRTALGI